MNIIGSILVVIGLVIGVLSAATAYLVPVDRIDPDKDRFELHAPAGRIVDRDNPFAPPQPVLQPGEPGNPLVLEQWHLAELRVAGVERVHVRQFSLRHWREKWLFIFACIGLFFGALMVRAAKKRELLRGTIGEEGNREMPRQLLDEALVRAAALREELRSLNDPREKLRIIMRRIDALKDECFEPLDYRRELVIDQLGMAGYARFMERFAAAERRFNRAWSAAVDGLLDEAETCCAVGTELLEESRALLPAAGHAGMK